jgi:hypothetical protein
MPNVNPPPVSLALAPHLVLILEQIRSEDLPLYEEILRTIELKLQTLETGKAL